MLRYLSADIICSEKRTGFPRAKLEENCELRGAGNVQGQISEHIFKVKLRLLCLLSFKYFSQHAEISRESAGSAILSYVNHVKVCQLASKISTSDFASGPKAFVWGKGKTFERKVNSLNFVKDKSKIQVADKVTGNLTTSREQLKAKNCKVSHSVKSVNCRQRNSRRFVVLFLYLVFNWSSTLYRKYNCGIC